LRKPDNKKITIAGKIIGAEGEFITLNSFEELKKTEIKEDGTFSISFNHDHEWIFSLRISDQYFQFFLEPGDSIYFSIDINDIDPTFYTSGDKAREAFFLKKKKSIDNAEWRKLIDFDRENYYLKKEEILHPYREYINELITENGIAENFISLEKAGISYFDLYMDNYYVKHHDKTPTANKNDSTDILKKEVEERINQIDFNDPLLVLNSYHRIFMDRKLSELRATMYNQVPESEKGTSVFMRCIMSAADSLFHNQHARDFIKYRHLSIMIRMSGPKEFQESYQKFIENNTTPMYSARLKEIVDKWKNLVPGMQVPEFTFYDIDGKEVRLSDLSGELIYIKVWITGCGVCLYEQSFWNKLIAEYDEKGVTFIAISIDKEKDSWIKMVKEKEIGGFNWFTENETDSEFAQHFMVKAVPKFILLDSDKKIINADAERPSGKIGEEINRHLREAL
jgi:thiol-disulfide isomerase/thioredoxin